MSHMVLASQYIMTHPKGLCKETVALKGKPLRRGIIREFDLMYEGKERHVLVLVPIIAFAGFESVSLTLEFAELVDGEYVSIYESQPLYSLIDSHEFVQAIASEQADFFSDRILPYLVRWFGI